MKTKVLVLSCLIILTCCDKEKVNDGGIFKLNSSVEGAAPNFRIRGFSFETMRIITYPNPRNQEPDFLVMAHTDETGKVLSPFLSSFDLGKIRFAKIDEFENYEAAFQRFNDFTLEDDYTFDIFALPVQPNQIWLIKMSTEKFGIILVKSTLFYEKENNTPFAEISFQAKKL